MFRWYRKAQMCFAYLEDFDASTTVHFEHRLRQVRWFKRGWTLQELIVPRTMDFFDKYWLCEVGPGAFGDKYSLAPKLARITRIDEAVLTGQRRLGSVSIAKRMSWAANRKTTKEEDIAYCLLGLFDLTMDLRYGEGAKAFVRLQEEIARTHDDQSLFAWEPDNLIASRLINQPAIRPEEGLSVFASHPRHYLSTADICHWDSWGDPPTIGNKGAKIVVPLYKVDARFVGGRYSDRLFNDTRNLKDIYLVPLNCTDRGDISYCPAIVVLHVTQDQFIRHPTARLLWIRESYVDHKSAKLWPIYLCKKSPSGLGYSSFTDYLRQSNTAFKSKPCVPTWYERNPVPESKRFERCARRTPEAPSTSVMGLELDA